MSANEVVGEVDIVLGGATYPMRPSFEAMRAIEKAIGFGLVRIMLETLERNLQNEHLAIIVTEAINAAGKHRGDSMMTGLNRDRVGRLIYESGTATVYAAVGEFLTNALNGGKSPSAEKKEDAAKTVTTT